MDKLIVIFVSFFFIMLPNLFAGEGVVGNGGNIINCSEVNTENQAKFHNKTLELFELSFLYGFNENTSLLSEKSEDKILKQILIRLEELDIEFYSYINKELLAFTKNSKHFDFDFNFSNDLEQSVIPKNCEIKTVVFQKEIKPYFLISKRWPSLPVITKSSLKLHEVIYRYRLSMYPDKPTSLPVRKLNAFLFSKEFFNNNASIYIKNLIKELEF